MGEVKRQRKEREIRNLVRKRKGVRRERNVAEKRLKRGKKEKTRQREKKKDKWTKKDKQEKSEVKVASLLGSSPFHHSEKLLYKDISSVLQVIAFLLPSKKCCR